MKRRVAITGIGAVSPNGAGRERFWEATKRGQSGVRRITRFDPSGIQVQIAGEVPDFDETAYVNAKDRPHVSRCVPLGIAAAQEAVADAGLEPERMTREEQRSIGVLIGSGGGSTGRSDGGLPFLNCAVESCFQADFRNSHSSTASV